MKSKITIWTWVTLAFICGCAMSLFTLPLWVIFAINVAKEGSRSDWLGLFGSLTGAVMTLLAAGFAWRAVQNQIDVQRGIANRQLAIQSFEVLVRQTELLEEEMTFVSDVLMKCGLLFAACGFFGFNDLVTAGGTAQKVVRMIGPYLEDIKAQRARFRETRTRRWIAPSAFSQRASVMEALEHLEAILPGYEATLKFALAISTQTGGLTDGQLAGIRGATPLQELTNLRETCTKYGEAIDALRVEVHAQTARAREEMNT